MPDIIRSHMLYDRKRSLLIYRTHKIMIATGAQREHSPDDIDGETFFKIEKGTSAHKIST